MSNLLVFTCLPDLASANALARELVELRLAACVNVLSLCRSVYRWQGAIEDAEEIPLQIKTTTDHYPALEKWVREKHPYELPEIIAVSICGGLPQYLEWVNQTCQS